MTVSFSERLSKVPNKSVNQRKNVLFTYKPTQEFSRYGFSDEWAAMEILVFKVIYVQYKNQSSPELHE